MKKIEPKKKHDVWGIDFLNLLLFGVYFRICVVYDLFSQAYLSIQPACAMPPTPWLSKRCNKLVSTAVKFPKNVYYPITVNSLAAIVLKKQKTN